MCIKLKITKKILDGEYREYLPSKALKKYISKYYFTEGFNSLKGKKINTINKCNAEMVIHYGEEKINFYNKKIKQNVKNTATIIGGHQSTNLREYKASGEIMMFTVEFNYIGILKLLSVYPVDIINAVINIEDVFGETSHKLLQDFFNETDDLLRIKHIENYFLNILKETEEKYCKENLLLEFMDTMVSSGKSIKKISEDLHINRRYIERNFKKKIGYSLKEFYKIMRINYACSELYKNYPQENLSEIAEKSKYFDLSHFNREFKQLTNHSPYNYLNSNSSLIYLGRGYLIYDYIYDENTSCISDTNACVNELC